MRHIMGLSIITSIFVLASGDIVIVEPKVEEVIKPTLQKHALKSNYQVVYNTVPEKVDSFSDMFTQGTFYGRLRSNTFYYGWSAEGASRNSHLITGLGGSLVYKSANFSNFDFTAGLYYSRAFFNVTNDPLNALKAGKDTLSRFNYANSGDEAMGVLGQAYLRYTGLSKTEIIMGRQLVETFYAKSNDTKMIPNTFDGIMAKTKVIQDTNIDIGYLFQQKLRDHTSAHSVLTRGDSNSTSSEQSQWSENDDSAMHKGLTYSRLKAVGIDTDAPLIVADVQNKSIDNLKLNASFYAVPELLSEVMVEANYKIQMDRFTITPGMRYISQFDNGAGAIGGASYRGQLAGKSGAVLGYKDASSLDSQMLAARIVTKYKNYKLNLGYSKVFDEADLVTPWRAFPTSGYTRSMARYNWMANTKSYRIEVIRNGNSKGIYKDIYTQMSILHTDADESKGYWDENYYYMGFVKNFPTLDNMQVRLRLGYNDTELSDFDSLDARFEINYQF